MPASPPSAPLAAAGSPGELVRARSSRMWRRLAGAALVVVVATVAYWPAMRGAFILDDGPLITENPIVQAPDGLSRFWRTSEATDYWPLTNTSFWLEWRLWGVNPTGYHVTNLILHIVAALLIWAILGKLIIPGAFLAALLFVVHPVNVESVAWISQRKNTLALVFFLLSILWYLCAEEAKKNSEEEKRRRGDEGSFSAAGLGRWYWLSLLAFLLAMLSKGSVAVLPVVLLLIVWWRQQRIGVLDAARTAPFFLIAAVLTYVNIWFQKHGLDLVVRDVDFTQRLAGAGAVVWFYLAKAVAPLHLVFVYPQWEIEPARFIWWLPLAAVLIVTLLLARRIRAPTANWGRACLFAWLFFCVALVPVLGFTDVGFMQYSLVADHYQHIAMIAVAALIGAVWSVWRHRSPGARRWATVIAVGLVTVLGLLTWQQNKLYSGPLPLYQATLEQNPNSWVIHNDVGVALRKIGNVQEAVAHYQQALRLRPDYADAHYNFGNVLYHLGQTESAIAEYEEALRLKPNDASAHDNLGSALAQMGRPQEAIEHFEQSLRIKWDSPITHNNLGNILADMGQQRKAIAHYRQALQLKPDYAEAHNNLGVALLDTDAPDQHAGAPPDNRRVLEAIEHYQEALRLKPGYTEAYANLAKAYSQTQQPAEAVAAAEKALELARSQGQTLLAERTAEWLKSYRGEKATSHDAAPFPLGGRTAP